MLKQLNKILKIISKEFLVSVLCVFLSCFLSWVFDEVIRMYITDLNECLESSYVSKLEYWFFLFFMFFILIYGARFIDKLIITAIKK